eukprot:s357_g45.t1
MDRRMGTFWTRTNLNFKDLKLGGGSKTVKVREEEINLELLECFNTLDVVTLVLEPKPGVWQKASKVGRPGNVFSLDRLWTIAEANDRNGERTATGTLMVWDLSKSSFLFLEKAKSAVSAFNYVVEDAWNLKFGCKYIAAGRGRFKGAKMMARRLGRRTLLAELLLAAALACIWHDAFVAPKIPNLERPERHLRTARFAESAAEVWCGM